MATIQGHPSVQAYRANAPALEITVCAECEGVKTILMLTGDRWFCVTCRNEGVSKPKQIAVSNPKRRKR